VPLRHLTRLSTIERINDPLTADAALISRVPRDPLPTITWWSRGQERGDGTARRP
jgi:hypothetical protein